MFPAAIIGYVQDFGVKKAICEISTSIYTNIQCVLSKHQYRDLLTEGTVDRSKVGQIICSVSYCFLSKSTWFKPM